MPAPTQAVTGTVDDALLDRMRDMHPDEEVPRCPECGGWITDDGYSTGAMDCCFWCSP